MGLGPFSLSTIVPSYVGVISREWNYLYPVTLYYKQVLTNILILTVLKHRRGVISLKHTKLWQIQI